MWTSILFALQLAVPPAPAPPSPCSAPEHRQFDFWIGDWDVRGPQGRMLGTNRITAILAGCGLQEEWTSADGRTRGVSHNAYTAADRSWHQAWIDTSANRLDLVGGRVGDAMVLEQKPSIGTRGAGVWQRITWTPLPDGRVRQHWEVSKDGGRSWTTSFDGYYSRRAP